MEKRFIRILAHTAIDPWTFGMRYNPATQVFILTVDTKSKKDYHDEHFEVVGESLEDCMNDLTTALDN